MDSESYLLKIIQSSTKHTQDSLFLQTTIGQGIRWPIVLLISTAVGALVVFLCLVWTMVRRPTSSYFTARNYDNDDAPPVIITSSPSSPKNSHWPNRPLDFEAHFFKDLIWPSQIHESHSELNLHVDERSPLLGPKKMVSWASADSVSIIPRINHTRRHSDQSPRLVEAQSTLKTSLRRYSVDMSPKASTSVIKTRTSSPINRTRTKCIDVPVMKPNKQSELHLQISKTIAVLDDLNKSLHSSHHLSDFTRGIIAQQRLELTAAKQGSQQKLLSSPVKNSGKPPVNDGGKPIKTKMKTKLIKTPIKLLPQSYNKKLKRNSKMDTHIGIQDSLEIVELERLLNAKYDTFQGQ